MPGFDLQTLTSLAQQGQNIIRDVGNLGGAINGLRDTINPNHKFDLNTFRSEFINRDPALTSHYMVTIPVSSQDARLLSFTCVRAELPGITWNTTETRRYGVGPVYSYPTANVLDTIQFSFLSDSSGRIPNFFHSWMKRIFNFDTTDAKFYVSEYKANYVADIKIELYSRKKDLYYTYTLINAFPMAVGNAQVAWENSQILQVPVAFKFDSYRFEQASSLPTDVNGILGSLNIPGLGGLGSTIGDVLRVPQQIQDISNQVNRTSDILGSLGNSIFNDGDI